MNFKFLVLAFFCFYININSTEIDADNPNIQYIGRFYFSNPKSPQFDYPGCYISAVFSGTSCAVKLKGTGNYFNVFIDDKLAKVLHIVSTQTLYNVVEGLSDSTHTIIIVKRTEALAGNICQFMGFVLDSGKSLLPPISRPNKKIEFIGDSWTCGYGNEAASKHESFTAKTENVSESFGPMVAKCFGADYYLVAYSGKGVVRNYGYPEIMSPNPLPTIYPKVCATAVWNWDFTKWIPDLVVVFLGRNDFSTSPQPPKDIFEDKYKVFISTIRANYPNAEILCVFDAYAGYPCISYIQNVVNDLNSQGDNKVHFKTIDFNYNDDNLLGADWHPNIAGHQAIAKDIIKHVKSIKPEWSLENIPPLVSLVGLSDVISATATITIIASDSDGEVNNAKFYVDDVLILESSFTKYTLYNWRSIIEWDSTKTNNGYHTIKIVVTDNTNTSCSVSRIIKVHNPDKIFKLITSVNPVGSGIVLLNPQEENYIAGSIVTLTAVPATNYIFINWSGDLVGNQNPKTVVMDSNKIVVANFLSKYLQSENLPITNIITINDDGINNKLDFGKDVEKVEIYNNKGNLISTLEKSTSSSSCLWYGTDNKGKKVKSGVYIYKLITDDGKQKTGTILVIK